MHSIGIFGTVSKGAKSAFDWFTSSLVSLFVFFVVGAAVLSIIEFTLTKSASSSLSFWKLLALGLGCIIAELLGLKNAILSWHKARFGGMVAWSLIWAAGFAFSLYNALGSASEFQAQRANAQVQQAAAYGDVRTDLASARERVAQDTKTLAEMEKTAWGILPKVDGKDVVSVAAAEALIKSYEGNARFMSLSQNCTAAQGPQARKFCADYADAKAAKANLEQKEAWGTKIEDARRQLAESRAHLAGLMTKASHTQTVTNDQTPFVATMVFLGMSADVAAFLEPIQVSFTNMILVSLAGVVIALSMVQGQPRTRWVDWNGVKRTWVGGEVPAATSTSTDLVPAAQPGTNLVLREVHTRETDSEFAKAIASLQSVQKFADLKAA